MSAATGDDDSMLRVVTDAIALAVFRVSHDLRFLWASGEYARLVQRDAAAIAGQNVSAVIGEEAFEMVRPYVERALAGERVEYEALLPVRGKGMRWVHVIYQPVHDGFVGQATDVTERRVAQEALRASELRFQAVFDRALDGFVLLNDQQRVIDANPAACTLLGRSREQLLGVHASELSREGEVDEARMARFQESGTARGEGWARRGDGTLRAIEYSASANIVPGVHLSVFRDIEERKRAEESLRFLEEASRIFASSIEYDETLAAVTQLAVPRMADWAAIDMVEGEGFRRVAVAHVDPKKVELAHELWRKQPPRPDDPGGVARAVRTGEPELIEEITDEMLVQALPDPDMLALFRSLGLASAMTIPLVVRERAVGAITFVSAESRRHYGKSDLAFAQELARRAGTAIEHALAYRESREANRVKDEFLATVSHELRTPLTAILGWARLLRTKPDVDIGRAIEIIERNARAQVRLIEDVLDVSRIITGKLKIELKPLDLTKVLRAAVEVVAPTAASKGVELFLQVGVEPCPFHGDADRLQQVFWNLLVNAVKFTPKGGRVEASLVRHEDEIVVRVHDTGRGIARTFLPHVFERFRQADGSSTRAEGGLGLGLAIVRHLVDAHGGRVVVESEGEGQGGSTFNVSLPANATLEAYRSSTTPLPSSSRPLAGVRIVVCDDDPDARVLFEEILSAAGADVRVTGGAEEALEAVAALGPDVLVSDIGMPLVDGYELARRVRALPDARLARTPAIAVTAYARGDDARQAREAGFQAHLAKPIDPEQLVATVAKVK